MQDFDSTTLNREGAASVVLDFVFQYTKANLIIISFISLYVLLKDLMKINLCGVI